jgi:hypothetical protein
LIWACRDDSLNPSPKQEDGQVEDQRRGRQSMGILLESMFSHDFFPFVEARTLFGACAMRGLACRRTCGSTSGCRKIDPCLSQVIEAL